MIFCKLFKFFACTYSSYWKDFCDLLMKSNIKIKKKQIKKKQKQINSSVLEAFGEILKNLVNGPNISENCQACVRAHLASLSWRCVILLYLLEAASCINSIPANGYCSLHRRLLIRSLPLSSFNLHPFAFFSAFSTGPLPT